jgi:hypothetical protein
MISTPASTTRFSAGDVITFAGTATDPEDGPIAPEQLSWRIVIKHCTGGSCHDHLFTSAVGSDGTVVVPDHEEDFYLELTLIATDSRGLRGIAALSVYPRTVRITLTTLPTGLHVVYNGQRNTAPVTRAPIAGSTRTIFAPSPQGDATFISWSDEGDQQHTITAGASDETYVATFSPRRVRPNVVLALIPDRQGGLHVAVRAGTSDLLPANWLHGLSFGAATNARIDAGGNQSMPGNFAVDLPTGARQTAFTVRRAVAGASTTIPLLVTDRCGEWRTFVGGGPGAF